MKEGNSAQSLPSRGVWGYVSLPRNIYLLRSLNSLLILPTPLLSIIILKLLLMVYRHHHSEHRTNTTMLPSLLHELAVKLATAWN